MKKRITALLLILVMCLSLVLVSCGSKNGTLTAESCEHVDNRRDDGLCDKCKAPMPISLFDYIEINRSVKTSLTGSLSFDLEGNSINGADTTNELAMLTESKSVDVPADEAAGTPAYVRVEQIIRVYNLTTGTKVFELKGETPNLYTKDDAIVEGDIILNGETVSGLGITVPDNMFVVATVTREGDITIQLRGLDGALIAEEKNADLTSSDFIEIITDKYFVFFGKLYLYDNGVSTVVTDTEKNNLVHTLEASYNTVKLGDKYFAVEDVTYNPIILVLDASLNVIKQNQVPTYNGSGIKTSYGLLSNGDIYIRNVDTTQVRDLREDSVYDYICNDYAYNIETYIMSWETGEIKQVDDLPFHTSVQILTPEIMNSMMERNGVEYRYRNIDGAIITGNLIIDGLVSDKTRTYVLNTDGTLGAELIGVDGIEVEDLSISVLPYADIYQLSTPQGNLLYSPDGTRIGSTIGYIDEYYATSALYIVGDTVYNYALTAVYTIPEEMTVYKVSKDGVYLTKLVEADPANPESVAHTIYYVLDGTAAEPREIAKINIGDTTSYIEIGELGYGIMKSSVGEGGAVTQTITVYAASGTKVLEISRTNTAETVYNLQPMANGEIWAVAEIVTTVADGTEAYKLHVAK